MTGTKSEVCRGAEDLLVTMGELRRRLRMAESTLRRALKKFNEGADIRTTVNATAKPIEIRVTLTEAMEDVVQARHRMRVLIFAAALEEGISIGDLGRLFGFSRQLAARYAKEARTELTIE